MIARRSLARWSHDHLLHGALVVVVAFAVEWSPAVAPLVASAVPATGRPLMVASAVAPMVVATGRPLMVASAGRSLVVAPVAPVGPVAVVREVA
jgi:hypothetical protein